MPLLIVRNDITKMSVDAIVNAANKTLLGGGGVDGCIHRAAGPKLLEECRKLGGCETGEAKVTKAYALPCRYVIHTVGPVWKDGTHGEKEALTACYRNSLILAHKKGCKTVAFPLISAGVYGYPKDQAIRVAVDTIGAFLLEQDMTVYLVIFDRSSYTIGKQLFADITAYIDDHYVRTHEITRRKPVEEPMLGTMARMAPAPCAMMGMQRENTTLDAKLKQLEDGFSAALLKLIDETGKKDSEIYKKANVDRKLFSKIRNNPAYKPSKSTALAFAIALELNLEQTTELLARAGFVLSHSSKFDVIIEYFIEQGNYDIFQINETLFAFDQSLLGA